MTDPTFIHQPIRANQRTPAATPQRLDLAVELDLLVDDDDPESIEALINQRDQAIRIAADALGHCQRLERVIDGAPCTTCDGTGYLLDQTYGYAPLADGRTPVQRCDQCQRYDGDDIAAAHAATDRGGGVDDVMWHPGPRRVPGDWSIPDAP